MFFYGLYILLAVIALLVARHNAWVGRQAEAMFGLKTGTFYKKGPHAVWVRYAGWPAFALLVALIIPTSIVWEAVAILVFVVVFELVRIVRSVKIDTDNGQKKAA
jgi:hypothetical protein